ncbi:MAG TPA: Hsp20/alpha crystallin family protein [Thermoanaerobaculaceae bacterium]|nr:Hsp20/alpha crystallin family protein [Thermoanaerobaculaceae bacterium]HRS17451.1 Hsp20/alpha crystallin family protein [Thermoanaerobaculaceae bacterium]
MAGPLRTPGELLRLTQRLRELLEPGTPLPDVLVMAAGPAPVGPVADLRETSDEVIVEVEVPGCPPDRLSLTLDDNVLVLQGEYAEPAEPGAAFLRVERPRGRFCRSIPLPAEVAMPPEAVLSRGVLTVRMRRAPEHTRRRVPVREAP